MNASGLILDGLYPCQIIYIPVFPKIAIPGIKNWMKSAWKNPYRIRFLRVIDRKFSITSLFIQ
jgi:hypothetical protein